MEMQLAAELAAFKAKFEAWKKPGSLADLRPKMKNGNVITRSFEKTGWWPLKKDSVMWEKAITQLGPLCAPTVHKLSDKPHHVFADVGDKHIKIRELVLKSFQQDFIDRANIAEEESRSRQRRKAARISIENTYCGKGFTKLEVFVYTNGVTISVTTAGPSHV